MGSAHPLNAPYQAFRTADGWIVIGGSNQRNWLRTLEALEAPHLADDPRFRENSDRMAHLKELEAALAPYFAERSSHDWLARFEALGVPAGPVYDVLEMQADPQVQARADGGRGRARDARPGQDAGPPGQVLRHPRRGPDRRPGLRPAHPRGARASTAFPPPRSRLSSPRARSWSPTSEPARMPSAGFDRLRRKTLERLRYETVTSNAWSVLRRSLAPLARLDLWLICRRDLTKPLPPCHARVPIEVKAASARELEQAARLDGGGGSYAELAALVGAGRQRVLRREGRRRGGRARPARHRQPALRGPTASCLRDGEVYLTGGYTARSLARSADSPGARATGACWRPSRQARRAAYTLVSVDNTRSMRNILRTGYEADRPRARQQGTTVARSPRVWRLRGALHPIRLAGQNGDEPVAGRQRRVRVRGLPAGGSAPRAAAVPVQSDRPDDVAGARPRRRAGRCGGRARGALRRAAGAGARRHGGDPRGVVGAQAAERRAAADGAAPSAGPAAAAADPSPARRELSRRAGLSALRPADPRALRRRRRSSRRFIRRSRTPPTRRATATDTDRRRARRRRLPGRVQRLGHRAGGDRRGGARARCSAGSSSSATPRPSGWR